MKAKKIKPSPPEPPKEQPKEPFLDYGDSIPNSCFYRGYCPECKCETRVIHPDFAKRIYCEDCEPRVVGVGNPAAEVEGLDKDPDAWAKAWDQRD